MFFLLLFFCWTNKLRFRNSNGHFFFVLYAQINVSVFTNWLSNVRVTSSFHVKLHHRRRAIWNLFVFMFWFNFLQFQHFWVYLLWLDFWYFIEHLAWWKIQFSNLLSSILHGLRQSKCDANCVWQFEKLSRKNDWKRERERQKSRAQEDDRRFRKVKTKMFQVDWSYI